MKLTDKYLKYKNRHNDYLIDLHTDIHSNIHNN